MRLDLSLPQAAPGPGPAEIPAAALDRTGPVVGLCAKTAEIRSTLDAHDDEAARPRATPSGRQLLAAASVGQASRMAA